MNPMMKAKNLIEKKMPDSVVRVEDLTGTQDHVGLIVMSDEFRGKRLIEQHRMIMDILKEEFQQKLHAVKITTMVKTKNQGEDSYER